jgi:hypothetical protein
MPRAGFVIIGHEKGRIAAAFLREIYAVSALTRLAHAHVSALTRLETRVRLADHEDLATTADHLAVAVTGLRRLQGGQHLHDKPRQQKLGVETRSRTF